jgi:hypothetical protein
MSKKFFLYAGCWWLKLEILAAWEVDIRRISVQGQHGQKCLRDPISLENWHALLIPRTVESLK